LLPRDEDFGFTEDNCVDLRYITPIQCRYFTEGKRTCSLSIEALADLKSQLGVFFTGLQIWWEPVSCTECGAEINPADYFVETTNDEDID